MRYGIVACALLFAGVSLAEDAKPTIDMMTPLVVEGVALKDTDTHLVDDWSPIITEGPRAGERIDRDPLCDHCQPLTLGAMLARTLKSIKRDEDAKVPGPMRESWAAFADKIKGDKEAKLTPKQIVLLNERIEAIVQSGSLILVLKKLINPGYEPKLPE